ncbi:TIGR03745 family integrating conjugative element membrane protein, partial [Pseudomonas amygdali]
MMLYSLFARAHSLLKRRPFSALLMTASSSGASAALPGAQAPTRGTGTSFLQTFQNYAFDGFTLLGLCLCAFGIILVGRHALGVYHE